MNDKTLVDTDVLIYTHDVDAKAKHEIAKTVMAELWSQRNGALSVHGLQEFYVNVTRKIPSPLSKGTVRPIVESYMACVLKQLQPKLPQLFALRTSAESDFGML